MFNLIWSSILQIVLAVVFIWMQLGLATIGKKQQQLYFTLIFETSHFEFVLISCPLLPIDSWYRCDARFDDTKRNNQ